MSNGHSSCMFIYDNVCDMPQEDLELSELQVLQLDPAYIVALSLLGTFSFINELLWYCELEYD